MDELDELIKENNEWIDRLLIKMKAHKERFEAERVTREKPQLIKFGLREHEAEAWLEQEPDFPRDIRRDFTGRNNRRRLDRTLVRVNFQGCQLKTGVVQSRNSFLACTFHFDNPISIRSLPVEWRIVDEDVIMKQIAVIGSSGPITSEVYKLAEELGGAIASAGAVLITGGRGGVMEAASKGAKKNRGLTVGILPGIEEDANPYVDVVIVTGMGDARNVINVRSANAVIAVNGGAGTLSEIGHALKAGKRVIALRHSGGVAESMAGAVINGGTILSADSAREAVELALEKLA